MSDYPKKMLFITGLSEGGSQTAKLIPVDVLGKNPRISGGLYIRYPHGGSDTTQSRFLFELPEGLQSENEALRQQLEQAQAESLQAIANKVCGHAPEGWIISFCMENGSAWAEASRPDGGDAELPDSADQTLVEQINDALCVAKGWISSEKAGGEGDEQH